MRVRCFATKVATDVDLANESRYFATDVDVANESPFCGYRRGPCE